VGRHIGGHGSRLACLLSLFIEAFSAYASSVPSHDDAFRPSCIAGRARPLLRWLAATGRRVVRDRGCKARARRPGPQAQREIPPHHRYVDTGNRAFMHLYLIGTQTSILIPSTKSTPPPRPTRHAIEATALPVSMAPRRQLATAQSRCWTRRSNG
jgi:hypothetical protein